VALCDRDRSVDIPAGRARGSRCRGSGTERQGQPEYCNEQSVGRAQRGAGATPQGRPHGRESSETASDVKGGQWRDCDVVQPPESGNLAPRGRTEAQPRATERPATPDYGPSVEPDAGASTSHHRCP
jgi:hypothetical protein